WTVENDRITWDARMHELFGLKPGEFNGTYEAFRGRVHPEDQSRARAAVRQAIETLGFYRGEYRILGAADEVRWLAAEGRAFAGETGTAARLIGVVRDITERKLNEALIDGQRQVLELVARGAPLADTLELLLCVVEAQSPG